MSANQEKSLPQWLPAPTTPGVILDKQNLWPSKEERDEALATILAELSEPDKQLAELLQQFMPQYTAAGSLKERKDIFKAFCEKRQALFNHSGLPTAASVAKIVSVIFYNYRFFYCSDDKPVVMEHKFFTEATLTRMLQAIKDNRPIIEIGPGVACLAITAALLGAHVIGVESTECTPYYLKPVIPVDGLTPIKGIKGSFQMHNVTGLPAITIKNLHDSTDLDELLKPHIDTLYQDDNEHLSPKLVQAIKFYQVCAYLVVDLPPPWGKSTRKTAQP